MSTSIRCSQCKCARGLKSFSRMRNGNLKKSCDPCLGKAKARRIANSKRRHNKQQNREIQAAKAVLRIKHLPPEIQSLIYEYDSTYKTRYTTTVKQFEHFITPSNLFIVKPKFSMLFGSVPMYARCVGQYWVRLTSVETGFDLQPSSILIQGFKLPLCFKPFIPIDEDRSMYARLMIHANSRDRHLEFASWEFYDMGDDTDSDIGIDTDDSDDDQWGQ